MALVRALVHVVRPAEHGHEGGRPVEHVGEPGSLFLDLAHQGQPLDLVLPLGGDVAGDLRGADDVPVAVAKGRHGERDESPIPVPCPSHRLEVLDPLPFEQPGQDLFLLVSPFGRDDQVDLLSDGLLGGVAEQAFGPGVPGPDRAVERLADDGVAGGLDDGGKLRLRILDLVAFGGIPEHEHRTRFRSSEWAEPISIEKFVPVPGHQRGTA
jgi:hypothetical protein